MATAPPNMGPMYTPAAPPKPPAVPPMNMGPVNGPQPNVPATPAPGPMGPQRPTTTPPTGALAAAATTPPTSSADIAAIAGPTQGPTTYTPSDNSLVSKQLTNLLAQDNPYMQRAATGAMQYANSRGLLNSSIAATAGQAAAIDAALPIAQADAGTYFTAQRDNAGVQNTFTRDANTFAREGALTIARGNIDSAAREDNQAFTAAQNDQQFQNRLTEISAQTDAQLKVLDAQNGTNLYNSYRQQSDSVYDDYAAEVSKIQASDMTPEVKAAQIQSLQKLTAERQDFLNVMYAESPGWSEEWAQFMAEFEV